MGYWRETIHEFLEMGGYAAYIWSSYGLVLAVLVGLLITSFLGVRARERELAALEERFGHRRPRRRQQDVETHHNT
jgi:heme exporter protein D